MAHGGSGGGLRSHRRRLSSPGTLVRVGRRLGTALVGAALPALVATVGAAAATGEAASRPLGWTAGAMATSVLGGAGLQWAFHVAAVLGLAGLWVLGLSLVVEGYLR